jgi:uncharacterized membrane protein
MPIANDALNYTVDPAWPWSMPAIGVPALLICAGVLVGLTIWTYVGVRGARRGRVLTLVALRLAALLLACLAVLRPSLAFQDEQHTPSTLLIVVDGSESMTIQDQYNNMSRWDYLRRLLRDCEPQFRKLRDEHNITVVLSRFAGEVGEYDPEGKADGKRTDFGEMLHTLFERHASERNLRGLLILSDGADNGARYSALPLASRWRGLPCPIDTFAFGQTTTTSQQRDLALTAINPVPSPVAIKGQLKVKGLIDAAGFALPAQVNVRLLLNGEQVTMEKKTITRPTGNEVAITCDAPATPGEIRVTLKVDPLAGELTQTNNEISTYVTVTKEGISVLYVEGKYRAWEPKYIRAALAEEPSIRLWESVRLREDDAGALKDVDPYQFGKRHYDVIIIGDVSAGRLSGGDPQILQMIYKQVVEKGAGLMMIGGYETFGNSDWDKTVLEKLLPVRMDARGQVEGRVQMVPTPDGLRHYVLRLADNEADNATIWRKLRKLEGMTRLGEPKTQAQVLAKSSTGEPMLVSEPHGAGRVLAFAGDTTWQWCNTLDGLKAHHRFWRQVIFWLAKRDEAEGNVLILPDSRRLPAGGKEGFGLKLRGKGGVEIPEKDARFDVSVIGPDQVETKVPISFEHGEARGNFWKTDVAGEYQIIARGTGIDTDGKPLENLAPARVRFLVYQDEAEMARQAADHDFLEKLANAGGGKFHLAEDLKTFLKDLAEQPLPQAKPKAKLWPDWRRTPPSRSAGDQAVALAGSGILASYLLFVVLLCLEWFLRRYWGLV